MTFRILQKADADLGINLTIIPKLRLWREHELHMAIAERTVFRLFDFNEFSEPYYLADFDIHNQFAKLKSVSEGDSGIRRNCHFNTTLWVEGCWPIYLAFRTNVARTVKNAQMTQKSIPLQKP